MDDIFKYKNDELEEVTACPWCSSASHQTWADPNRNFPVVKCEACGVVFLSRRLNEKGRKCFYNSYVRLHETTERLEQRLKIYEIEFGIISNIVPSGNVLDVGCGSGRFLSCFPLERYRRFGVEYGGEAADMARRVIGAATFYEGDLLGAPFKNKNFDLVTFRGVLEHLPNPREILDRACSLIKQGGCIFITSMPNLECICAEIFRSYWTQHREFEHLIHFGKSHFRRYFKECGFVEMLDKELYWDTPYSNPKEDVLRVAEAIYASDERGAGVNKTSPAFWGNVLSMAFKKIN